MSSGITHRVIVKNPEGLHLRPADQLVRMAGRYQSEIRIGKLGNQRDNAGPLHHDDGASGVAQLPRDPDESGIGFDSANEMLDCKSILSLLTLGAAEGDVLTLSVVGPDAPQAVDDITRWFDSGFSIEDESPP